MKAIRFDSVSKQFTLHRERPRSFQELFLHTLRREHRSNKEEYWALRDVSFDIEPGETIGLIGPNGAGKSTALKLMARIIEPTSGKIEMNGQVGALLELGAGFHPDLTGRENIYLNGSILGFSRSKMNRIFGGILDFSEMERFIDVPVKHYSSGMYMRLAFSIAICIEPDILLVDEVLAVGDQSFQLRCLDKISEMKRQDTTILLVTHDLGSVRELCDRAIWLDDGIVQAQGSVDRVLNLYVDQVYAEDVQQLLAAQQIGGQASAEEGEVVVKVKPEEEEEEEEEEEAKQPWRWGSREAEFVNVQLLNEAGQETRAFRTGDRFIARMHYVAHRRIERPLFGIALHHANGFHINGPNTGTANYPISAIDGKGYVDYMIPSLPLMAGTYLFSAALYDHEGKHAFDHHHMAYTFRVVPGTAVREEYGSFYIPSDWELISEASTMKRVPVEARQAKQDD